MTSRKELVQDIEKVLKTHKKIEPQTEKLLRDILKELGHGCGIPGAECTFGACTCVR